MFKTKSKKMREVVARQLYLMGAQLKNFIERPNEIDIVHETLIAQNEALEERLRSLDIKES